MLGLVIVLVAVAALVLSSAPDPRPPRRAARRGRPVLFLIRGGRAG